MSRGYRLTTAAGLILVVCGVRGLAIAVEFGGDRVQAAGGALVFRTDSSAFDLLALTALAGLGWLLVGIAVSRRGGVWRWLGVPSGILLAVAARLWQPHDSGLLPFALDPSVAADAALLALGIAALSIGALASGLVVGTWRRVAGSALLLGALSSALMQTMPRDEPTPGIALATAALSLGEPLMIAILGVVLIAGVQSSRRPPLTSARRVAVPEAVA
ncbi:hypothetical protein GRS96_00200 [Rathayibacter sp. VKM Ac-2803]|uniref:hypothetical protein n=1 Tax=unclassified Rathayibacter TaxID=2609250 RepID=UPI00135AE26B|nr:MULTISPECIES: hypothetical protein [unclassified Rathayibacter]MWV47691.1 hypothetical protein [Rathayibacter sp. VKM Ac-2803]MWV57848.1 hypothetical protein [Rathayibacter sp. VKM Ac-2754]